MQIKLDAADIEFSKYIRLRDKRCLRCGSQVKINPRGLPISHQASHYFGRGKESTRFDPENVDCLCYGCHRYWGSVDRESYREFKIKHLGQNKFKLLTLRANQTVKKDRKLSLIKASELLKTVRLKTAKIGQTEK